MDLQAGELLPDDIDPLETGEEIQHRYEALWEELTREETLRPAEQRHRIAKRLRRLNDLGFDADELELISTPDGSQLRIRTKVAEAGQHSAQLFRQTGISADEHQARRLLNDIASFRGYLEQKGHGPVSETVAAHRWLEEVYDPVVEAIPLGLRGRLAPPEIFHEILEHRWYLSEQAGRDVGTTAAANSYFETVLPNAPDPLAKSLKWGRARIWGNVNRSRQGRLRGRLPGRDGRDRGGGLRAQRGQPDQPDRRRRLDRRRPVRRRDEHPADGPGEPDRLRRQHAQLGPAHADPLGQQQGRRQPRLAGHRHADPHPRLRRRAEGDGLLHPPRRRRQLPAHQRRGHRGEDRRGLRLRLHPVREREQRQDEQGRPVPGGQPGRPGVPGPDGGVGHRGAHRPLRGVEHLRLRADLPGARRHRGMPQAGPEIDRAGRVRVRGKPGRPALPRRQLRAVEQLGLQRDQVRRLQHEEGRRAVPEVVAAAVAGVRPGAGLAARGRHRPDPPAAGGHRLHHLRPQEPQHPDRPDRDLQPADRGEPPTSRPTAASACSTSHPR